MKEDEVKTRPFATLLVVLVALIALVACVAQPTATLAPEAEEPEEAVLATEAPEPAQEVQWTIWAQTGSPAETELIQRINERFMADHPGLTIELQTTADYVQMTNNLKLALPAGEGPDIAYTQPGPAYTTKFGEAGWVIDLQPYIEKHGIDKVVSQEMIQYFNTDSHGNFVKNYALPWDVIVQGIYYNADIFEKEGLKPPTTWQEWGDLLKRLKERGYIPLGACGQDPGLIGLINWNILTLSIDFEELTALQYATGEAHWDIPEVAQSMQYVRDWYQAGYHPGGLHRDQLRGQREALYRR